MRPREENHGVFFVEKTFKNLLKTIFEFVEKNT